MWFDEWVLKPGDSIPAKIEEGLEHSRVLVLCMSAHVFGSEWAQLEAGTSGRDNSPFRSPNFERGEVEKHCSLDFYSKQVNSRSTKLGL